MLVLLPPLWFTTTSVDNDAKACDIEHSSPHTKSVHLARHRNHRRRVLRSNASQNMLRVNRTATKYQFMQRFWIKSRSAHLPARYYRHLCHCHRIGLFNFIKLLPRKQCKTTGWEWCVLQRVPHQSTQIFKWVWARKEAIKEKWSKRQTKTKHCRNGKNGKIQQTIGYGL